MSFTIAPATPADIPRLVDIFYISFGDIPAWPDKPGVRKWWASTYNTNITHPRQHLYVARFNSEIVAVAQWNEVSGGGVEDAFEWSEDSMVEVLNEVHGKKMEKQREIMGGEKFLYLKQVATVPEARRKGAASLLLMEMCRQADGAGIACYVEASDDGAPTYRKFDFEDKSTLMHPVGDKRFREIIMVRRPNNRSRDGTTQRTLERRAQLPTSITRW